MNDPNLILKPCELRNNTLHHVSGLKFGTSSLAFNR